MSSKHSKSKKKSSAKKNKSSADIIQTTLNFAKMGLLIWDKNMDKLCNRKNTLYPHPPPNNAKRPSTKRRLLRFKNTHKSVSKKNSLLNSKKDNLSKMSNTDKQTLLKLCKLKKDNDERLEREAKDIQKQKLKHSIASRRGSVTEV